MTGYDPMSLSIEMPEVEFGEAADLGEEAIYYRHFKPVILWKLQNWIGVGLERKMKILFSVSIKCLRRSYLQEERRYAAGKERHQWTR
ncbi:unnamed protein product [Microthlaspi erraticum]|uniref:Uncharacterized protein n=1 Tax=Microthlaspi erraticum TaxID=1685480 RepID=A0A6D2JB86_9BRAS|nr:unnamed protein product [Microthlaspi erraticum]